jgi:hypothetical protein
MARILHKNDTSFTDCVVLSRTDSPTQSPSPSVCGDLTKLCMARPITFNSSLTGSVVTLPSVSNHLEKTPSTAYAANLNEPGAHQPSDFILVQTKKNKNKIKPEFTRGTTLVATVQPATDQPASDQIIATTSNQASSCNYFSQWCPHCEWSRNGKKTHIDEDLCYSIGGLPNTLHFQSINHGVTFSDYCKVIIGSLDWVIQNSRQQKIPMPTLLHAGLTPGKQRYGYTSGQYEHNHSWVSFSSEGEDNAWKENTLEMVRLCGVRPDVEQLHGKCLNRGPYITDRFVVRCAFEESFMCARVFEGHLLKVFEQTSGIEFEHGRDYMYLYVEFSDGLPYKMTLASDPRCLYRQSVDSSSRSAAQTNRQGVMPTNRQGVMPTNRQGVMPTNRQGVMPTNRQGVMPTNRQGVMLTNRQGVMLTNRQGTSQTNCQGTSSTNCQSTSQTNCQSTSQTNCQGTSQTNKVHKHRHRHRHRR